MEEPTTSKKMDETAPTIGVIGTGTISSAVVTGCLTPSEKSGGAALPSKFVLSARSAAKSAALRQGKDRPCMTGERFWDF